MGRQGECVGGMVRWSMRPSTFDRMMLGSNQRRYYGNSGYFNFGYWGAGAKSQAEASDALVDQLVARLGSKSGRILDVACGLGGSTRRLTQTYSPETITGINFSEAQIAEALVRAPGCTFKVMNATRLDFPDNHFTRWYALKRHATSTHALNSSEKLTAC
jgi:MPBQ/MSBQ methyltransferase